MTSTLGTWYPPSFGTGGFLLANPPFNQLHRPTMANLFPTTIPPFISANFYPGYAYKDKEASGRYVALGSDGKVYCCVLNGDHRWELIGADSYPDNETSDSTRA